MRSPARVGGLALEKAHEPAPNGAVLTSHPSIIFLDGLFELGDNICLIFINYVTCDTITRFLPVEKFAAKLFELGNWNGLGYNIYVGTNPYLPLARERCKQNVAIVRSTPASWGSILGSIRAILGLDCGSWDSLKPFSAEPRS